MLTLFRIYSLSTVWTRQWREVPALPLISRGLSDNAAISAIILCWLSVSLAFSFASPCQGLTRVYPRAFSQWNVAVSLFFWTSVPSRTKMLPTTARNRVRFLKPVAGVGTSHRAWRHVHPSSLNSIVFWLTSTAHEAANNRAKHVPQFVVQTPSEAMDTSHHISQSCFPYLEMAFRISVVNSDTAQKGTSTE